MAGARPPAGEPGLSLNRVAARLTTPSVYLAVLGGQAIYGVDWSGTPMARLPWDLTSGGNPALHHMAYFPLTVLVGIPVRLLTGTLGLGFDYRIVLIAFALLGLFAIATLPVAAERRLMVLAAIYVSPLITLYLWSGRNDIEFLATVLL